MRAAFDGRVKFGDTLIVVADVVVAVETTEPANSGTQTLRITHQRGHEKTWELRSRVIASLRGSGPSLAAAVLDAIGLADADPDERRRALQTMSRMVRTGDLVHARADKGKLRKRYQLPAGA
jgi:hypothetical protein